LNKPKVLLIDDQWGSPNDPMMRETYGNLPVQWILHTSENENGHKDVKTTVAYVTTSLPAVILLDINFGVGFESFGLEILEGIRQSFPILPILMYTSLESEENRELVIRCLELGANEYIEKAVSPKALQTSLMAYLEPQTNFGLYGNSPVIRQLRATIARVCFSNETSVLVFGPSGSGKELVARALHRQGRRKNGPFVVKNCAHSDSDLLESELFGHESGSFTGAATRRIGLLEEAHQGILFLDEVADMPTALQAKLLRAIETKSFRRLGSSQDRESNFQLVCATNQPPELLVREGRMREDFYYRVSPITLRIPALKDRPDDIEILANLFLQQFTSGSGASYPGREFSPLLINWLRAQSWKGNVRELRNVVERSVILSKHTIVEKSALDQDEISTNHTLVDGIHLGIQNISEHMTIWPIIRLSAELNFLIQAKQHVQSYKGRQWKAEFMRQVFPDCKSANAKGFSDLIHRFKRGPWGFSQWETNEELSSLILKLEKDN
jgi:DNA-binding NtrC family response regulator